VSLEQKFRHFLQGAGKLYFTQTIKIVIKKNLTENHQTNTRLGLTLATKTLNVLRALDRAKISISTYVYGMDFIRVDR
jgi:hypothetical protein